MYRKMKMAALGLTLCALLAGCAGEQEKKEQKVTEKVQTEEKTEKKTEAQTEKQTEENTEKQTETQLAVQTERLTEGQTEDGASENADLSDGLFGVFETMTLDGETVDQNIFTGADLNMVNIWGTFCGPCIREMPELGELSREYAEKGVRLIGIISDVSEPGNEAAEKIIEETGADYTHLILSESLVMNYLAQVQGVPTTIFLDKEGKQVGDVCVGAKSKDDWAEIIEEKLEEIQK